MNANRFNSKIEDKEVSLYHISTNNISCYITNFGARVVSLFVNDKDGQPTDVVLGFDSLDGYLNADEQYHGAIVGRYANRIAHGKFTLNDNQYTLNINNPPNSLHGGNVAFHNQVWKLINIDEQKVVLELISPHLDEGFPGELTVQVTYQVKGSDLLISYLAKSTEDTIINLTHHSYFNLNGEGSGSVLAHQLKINSEYFTVINQDTIPTGKLELVANTPFDFNEAKEIGKDIHSNEQQLIFGYGYDHNYAINNYNAGALGFVAQVISDKSKIKMEVWSTEPGVQFYSANHLSGMDVGKSGMKYNSREAFCLETQHFPDSPNQKYFPSTVLLSGELFQSKTEYRFGI